MSIVDDGMATLVKNLPEKTGKSLEEWQELIKSLGITKHGEIVKYIKSEHGVTHGFANQIALRCTGSSSSVTSSGDDLVEAQYAGAKADLRPIYDHFKSLISQFGSDVEFAPKKANVSVRRSKQFCILQPSTAARFDVGLVLKGLEPTDRLEASGSFNAMLTHRVRVTSIAEVDDELMGWLSQAYELA